MSSKASDDDFSEITASMYNTLNRCPISFPSGTDRSCTLEQVVFDINNKSKVETSLPMLVKITALNEYGRKIKGLISKNMSLLLLNIGELDSVLAEYHHSGDGRQHLPRNRLAFTPKKFSAKTFRTMRKLSRSVATVNTAHQTTNNTDQNHLNEEKDEEDVHNQRNLRKVANEKRSSLTPLCRIPINYTNVFELLNENDEATKAFHILNDLLTAERSADNSTEETQNWPQSFFLRSSCKIYTAKCNNESSMPTEDHSYLKLNSRTDFKSSRLSDANSVAASILLNDDGKAMPAGQILTILNSCEGVIDEATVDKELPGATRSSSSASTNVATKGWVRKSKQFLSKFRWQSGDTNTPIFNEIVRSRSTPGKTQPFLKCRTQRDEIVYIYLYEEGYFSPLNYSKDISRQNSESNNFNISGVFQLKDIVSNFRFPLSVRLLNGFDEFDTVNFTAVVDPDESKLLRPTKLRLLAPYKESVVFVCPLQLSSAKFQKNSSSITVIPISINADIQVQPCINMSDVCQNEVFQKIVEKCSQIVNDYKTEISLINVPLQASSESKCQRQPLFAKRSQSESNLDYLDGPLNSKHRYSGLETEAVYGQIDELPISEATANLTAGPMEKSFEKNMPNIGKVQSSFLKLADYTNKTNDDNAQKHFQDNLAVEDEMYEDVDKIYDYIRSGHATSDVQRIQAKEIGPNRSPKMETTQLILKVPTIKLSPVQNIRQKLLASDSISKGNDQETNEKALDVDCSRNDGNVNDDEARVLYRVWKQSRDNLQNGSNSNSPVNNTRTNNH